MIIRSRAPLRIGLAGGGTDVSPFCELYGGLILNSTVSLFAYTNLEPRLDGRVRFVAGDREQWYEGEAICEPPIKNGELALHRGVYRRIMRDFNRGEPISVTLTTYCDAPPGSGLGSSSTLVVSMVQAFAEFLGLPLGEYDIAHLAYQIERTDLGLSGGRQDQYSAAFGGFNFMEFYANDRVIVNPLRIKNATVTELEASMLLCYTGVSRLSSDIIDEQADNVKRGLTESIEATKKLKDEALAMKEALLRGEIRRLAAILNEGWESKKKTASRISNPRIDEIYRVALQSGALAGKVSGAGGGGFMLFLVDPPTRPEVTRVLQAHECSVMNCHFTERGSEAWRVCPEP